MSCQPHRVISRPFVSGFHIHPYETSLCLLFFFFFFFLIYFLKAEGEGLMENLNCNVCGSSILEIAKTFEISCLKATKFVTIMVCGLCCCRKIYCPTEVLGL